MLRCWMLQRRCPSWNKPKKESTDSRLELEERWESADQGEAGALEGKGDWWLMFSFSLLVVSFVASSSCRSVHPMVVPLSFVRVCVRLRECEI